MPSSRQNKPRRTIKQNSKLVLPVIAVCSVVVAACVAFGSPLLWSPARQPQPDNTAPSQDEAVLSVLEGANDSPNSTDMVVISEGKTISQSEDANRATNLSLAVAAINNKEIKPGETFSFNSVVGDTENDGTYQIAPVVFGGQMTTARGGGICQVSTALYIAGLKADMEVVERHPHSIVTDYAPIGLDATLVYGVMDLQLKNTSEYPIYIYAEAVGQSVTVKLVGHPLKQGYTIDAVSQIADRYADPNQQQDASTNASSSTTVFYIVDSYRMYYQDGVKVGQQYLSTDTYEVNESSVVTSTEGGFSPTK
ncbi:MAG: VanW family protein [Eggerthellaceae bacterium]|nr:VanW family protein [Eggerthellaceae bacterium]